MLLLMFVVIFNLSNGCCTVKSFINIMLIVMWDPTKKVQQKYHMLSFHCITPAIYPVKGPDAGLIYSKTFSQSHERECKLCFDR